MFTDPCSAQYLKLLRFKHGYLINFNHRLLKNGIKRIAI